MRKLTTVESRYWIDSFPVDLAIAAVAAICVMTISAPLVFHFAMRYFATHRVLDAREHRPASVFLSIVLALFAGFGSAALTMVIRLFTRMYRNPL